MKRRFFLCLIYGGFILFSFNSFSETARFGNIKKNNEEKIVVEEFDEFDDMVNIAIIRGVLKPEIEFEKPSKIELILRKIGLPFIRLYICSIHKFRAIKSWSAQWWKNRVNWKLYALIFGKQKQKELFIEK